MPRDALDQPVTAVPGIGPARARLLEKLAIYTVEDLLCFAPRRHLDARRVVSVQELVPGLRATVAGRVVEAERRPTRTAGLWLARAVVEDDAGGRLELVAFARGKGGRRPAYVPLPASPGDFVLASGVPERGPDGVWRMPRAEVEPLERGGLHTGRLVPEYPLTAGLTQRMMRRMVQAALDAFADEAREFLPEDVVRAHRLPPRGLAFRQLHFPGDGTALAEARRRLAFEELFLLRLAVGLQGRARAGRRGVPLPPPGPLAGAWLRRLPFEPTGAQRRAMRDIDGDTARDTPMQRLLQGDVGSGKTLVAAYALLRAVEAGGQAALLAPSEILAEQHAGTLSGWFEALGVPVHLLTGSTPAAWRERALRDVRAGRPVIVVGTHALLGPAVRFRRLLMLVVDEQHRFGVRQRNALAAGRPAPHLLVVSATPIPRTLALCLYGDLDVSVLDEAPPGRRPVDTRWVRPHRREEVYAFVRRRVEAGERAFVVFPAIGGDGEEAGRGEAADTEVLAAAEKLAGGVLQGVRIGVLHGRQAAEDQAAVMRRFRDGDVQVLFSTTIVEVGVDVPQASVMVIEGADRFGLAQLHQLRGRVGRDGRQAYCFLIADPATDAARRRLHAVRGSTDGFALAQADLELRGPGELLGVRQAGLPDLSPLAREAPGHVAEAADRAVRNLLSSGATGAGGLSESLRRRLEKRFGMAALADEGPGV